jgi:hypothetical protein
VKYKQRELNLQAAKAKAKAKAIQYDDSNHDLESNLFKAQGISEVESEDIKWMK